MRSFIQDLDEKLKSRPVVRLAVALLVSACAVRLVTGVFGMRYETNDDATFANIAAGAYGSDNLHLIHPELLFSLILRPLYALMPGHNWYVLVQVGLAVLSVAAIITVFEKNAGTRGLLAGAALIIPFSFHIFYYFQFTRISSLAVTAGLILIADGLGYGGITVICGTLLVLVGSSIRFESFIMAGGLSSMLLLNVFFRLERERRGRAVLRMAVLFAAVFGAHLADSVSYGLDPEWKSFRSYHKARIEFSDFKVYSLDPDDNPFRRDGISDTDYSMLLSWDYYDPDFFTADLVSRLAAEVPSRSLSDSLRDTLTTAKSLVRGESFRYAFMLTLLAGLAITFLTFDGLFFVLTYLVFAVLLLYLHYRSRFPLWVQASMLMSTAFLAAFLALRSDRRKRIRVGAYAAFALALAALSVPAALRTAQNSRIYHDWTPSKQQAFERMSRDKEHLYVVSVENLDALAGYDVLHPRSEDFFSNIAVCGGMLSHSPYLTRTLDGYGMRRPLVDGVDREDVYYDGVMYERNERYILEQTGTHADYSMEGNNPMAPYRIVSRK